MYKHSLWGVEGPLHEQDPGHDHGEHVLHPRRHLVGGRRSEVDVQHPHLRVRNANKLEGNEKSDMTCWSLKNIIDGIDGGGG